MKKIFNDNHLIAIAFITVFTLSATQKVQAEKPLSEVPVAIKYYGNVNTFPVFELSFNGNTEQNNFTILISDEFGNSLYRENIKGEIFTKKFAINTEELGESSLKFEIISNKTKNSVVFEVNRNSKIIQEIEIVAIK